ncbi:lipase secretion chaperone [Chitinolyticbacter meiyuanensis]|uniref:lipase secretion chaperone n=1 Tax=Chitinolyticbacter meiyuanensis TaxID=682798 RepID=UPI0011E5F7EC|nr:lipase secretion chaperone [Chitinolyticbacter meiyuanensis]
MRRILIALALLAGSAGAAWLWWPASSDEAAAMAAPATSPSPNAAANGAAAGALFAGRWGEGAPPPDSGERLAQGLATLTRTGPSAIAAGRLQDWWRDGQALCRAQQLADCRQLLLDSLAEWPDAQAAAVVRTALEKLPEVDVAEQRLVQSMNTPLSERLAKLSALRRALMGEEAAAAWFGREEAMVAFRAAVNAFAQSPQARAMPQSARMQQVEALRRQHYGAYYAELKVAEGAQTGYQIEYGLAQLNARDVAADAALRQQLQARYFDPATAQAMATLDADHAAQQARQRAYAAALAELEARHADRDSTAYQQQLAALRQRLFASP